MGNSNFAEVDSSHAMLTQPSAAQRERPAPKPSSVEVNFGIQDEYGFECRLATEVAERFGKESAVFVEPMQLVLSAVESASDPRTASAGRHEVRRWLKNHSK